MSGEGIETRSARTTDGHEAALPGAPGPAGQGDAPQAQQTQPDAAAQSSGPEQQQLRTLAEIETIAVAARAAWHSAERVQQATRDEGRALYANFKKVVDHHASTLKHLEARFEQNEQNMRAVVLEANRGIAEHQAMVARFNQTTRRIALSAFVMMLILLVALEISWWLN